MLLTVGMPVPATPLPAPSPFSAAMVRRFEAGIQRFDKQFITAGAGNSNNLLIQKTTQFHYRACQRCDSCQRNGSTGAQLHGLYSTNQSRER